jgi:predicted alpha/beta-fold hydrolase
MAFQEVKNVKIPLLVLHANDDPLVPTHIVPKKIMEENPYIVYAETQKGGHVAWLSGFIPTRGLSWLDRTNMECIEGFIEHFHPEASPKVQRVIRQKMGSVEEPGKGVY